MTTTTQAPTTARFTYTAGNRNGHVVVTYTAQLIAGQPNYRVETATTGGVLDAWSRSFTDEAQAMAAAVHVAEAFNTHGTADAIERRAQVLRFQNRDLLNIRRPLTTNERRTHAAVNAELDRLADLNELANTAALNALYAA